MNLKREMVVDVGITFYAILGRNLSQNFNGLLNLLLASLVLLSSFFFLFLSMVAVCQFEFLVHMNYLIMTSVIVYKDVSSVIRMYSCLNVFMLTSAKVGA